MQSSKEQQGEIKKAILGEHCTGGSEQNHSEEEIQKGKMAV